MARVSTHILDLARGAPADGVRIELYRISDGQREAMASGTTNVDGRLILSEGEITGVFELIFQAGDYFRAQRVQLTDPPFLDEVVIRFGVAAGASYHVPLLLSPYGYSTYRGS